MSEFEIVPFSERWAEPHAEFASRNYPGKRRRADPAYVRWKFRGSAQGDVPGLMVAVREGEVIGQAGLLPGIVSLRGQQAPLQWICEMMVDPDKRRLGVTRALFDEAFGRGIITLGPDPSAVARKALAAVGMDYVDATWVMVLPLKLGPVLSARYEQVARAERLISLAGRPVIRLRSRRLLAGASRPSAQACHWRDVVDLLSAHESTFTAPHPVHDQEFLEWRCSGLDGWQRELEAVRTDAGSYAILERESYRLSVHQWRADDEQEVAALFGRILYLAGSYGVNYIQTYAADEGEKARLEAVSFGARRTRTDVSVHPAGTLGNAGGIFRFAGYDSDYLL